MLTLATIVIVDTIEDAVDADDGVTSLREAIIATNDNPGPDVVYFDRRVHGETLLLNHGALRITDSLTIIGPGSDLLTLDASGSDPTPGLDIGDGTQVFLAQGDYSSLSISGVTVTGADTEGSGAIDTSTFLAVFNDITVVENGGSGIDSRDRTLLVTDSVIASNSERGLSFYGTTLEVVGSEISRNSNGGLYAGGYVRVRDSQILDNSSPWDGGGIYAADHLEITDSAVAGNYSGGSGGGIYGYSVEVYSTEITGNTSGSLGGGVEARSLTIVKSTFEGNQALKLGGGVYSEGKVNILSSDFTNNTSEFAGGAVYAEGSMAVDDSVFVDNTALYSGAIYSDGQTQVITRSTITGNQGGGIASQASGQEPLLISETTISNNTSTGDGGGLWILYGRAEISDSTISDNVAANDGGGIWAETVLTLDNVTLSGNQTGNQGAGLWTSNRTEVLHSTIVRNQAGLDEESAGAGGGIFVDFGPLTLDHSLVVDNTADTANQVAGIVSSTYSLIGYGAEYLGPLADNGGPTLTHALLPGSPAIDAGDSALVQGDADLPEFDQRGAAFARVAGRRIDIGAYESQSAAGSLDGDFDLDGDTDGTDFLAWQRGFGIAADAAVADGDATLNGVVDRHDLDVWQVAYGDAMVAPAVATAAAIDYVLTPDAGESHRQPTPARGPVARRNAWSEVLEPAAVGLEETPTEVAQIAAFDDITWLQTEATTAHESLDVALNAALDDELLTFSWR